MKNISAKARLARAEDLLKAAESLPKKLIEDNSEYYFSEENRGKPDSEGNLRRKAKITLAFNLHAKVRSYVKLAFQSDSEYFQWVDRITFTQEEKGYSSTFLEGMNREWSQGRASLIALLASIVSDEKERFELEKLMVDETARRQWLLAVGSFFGLLVIWNVPSEYLIGVFNESSLFAIRIILCTATLLCAAAFVFEEKWRELLISSIVTTLLGTVPFIKAGAPAAVPIEKVDSRATTTKTAADTLSNVKQNPTKLGKSR